MLVPTFDPDGVQQGYVNLAGPFSLHPVKRHGGGWLVSAVFFAPQYVSAYETCNPMLYVSRPLETREDALDFISDQFRPLVLPPRLPFTLAPRG